jgi:hypothetical protein
MVSLLRKYSLLKMCLPIPSPVSVSHTPLSLHLRPPHTKLILVDHLFKTFSILFVEEEEGEEEGNPKKKFPITPMGEEEETERKSMRHISVLNSLLLR